jgi:hypothetical protein
MKAAPLLRAWLHRLRDPRAGVPVTFHMRHRWTGWADDGALRFDTPPARAGCAPARCCWRWAAAAGHGWVRTAPGCRCWRRVGCRWRRCARPTAASTQPGGRPRLDGAVSRTLCGATLQIGRAAGAGRGRAGGVPAQRRVCRHRQRRGGQPGVCRLRPAARRHCRARQRHVCRDHWTRRSAAQAA